MKEIADFIAYFVLGYVAATVTIKAIKCLLR